ncbi:MAG: S8 family serine peptidase [Lachnospiraceae bacterium]
MELWASSPELYAISMTSPLGETIPTIPARLSQNITLNFTLERTRVDISYEIVESASGDQLIFIRFTDPTPGLWTLRVENRFYINGDFQLWLPITGFISPRQFFWLPIRTLRSQTPPPRFCRSPSAPTMPKTAAFIFIPAGAIPAPARIKPELAAPGVGISAVAKNGGLTSVTGTSAAAALTAGAAALWSTGGWRKSQTPHDLLGTQNFLIRGAGRSRDLTYPNRSWGYGTLNVYGVFESLL